MRLKGGLFSLSYLYKRLGNSYQHINNLLTHTHTHLKMVLQENTLCSSKP